MSNTILFFIADIFSVSIQWKPFYYVLLEIFPTKSKFEIVFQTDFSAFVIKPAFCKDSQNANEIKSFYMHLQRLNHHQESKLF